MKKIGCPVFLETLSNSAVSCLPWCTTPRLHAYHGVQLRGYMPTMCTTPRCQANHGVQLHGIMPTMCLTLLCHAFHVSNSAVSCLPWCPTPRCHAFHGVQLRGVMPAMVSNSAVSCYRRVYLSLLLEEIVIDYIFTSLSVAQMGLIDEKRGSKISCHTLF